MQILKKTLSFYLVLFRTRETKNNIKLLLGVIFCFHLVGLLSRSADQLPSLYRLSVAQEVGSDPTAAGHRNSKTDTKLFVKWLIRYGKPVPYKCGRIDFNYPMFQS